MLARSSMIRHDNDRQIASQIISRRPPHGSSYAPRSTASSSSFPCRCTPRVGHAAVPLPIPQGVRRFSASKYVPTGNQRIHLRHSSRFSSASAWLGDWHLAGSATTLSNTRTATTDFSLRSVDVFSRSKQGAKPIRLRHTTELRCAIGFQVELTGGTRIGREFSHQNTPTKVRYLPVSYPDSEGQDAAVID